MRCFCCNHSLGTTTMGLFGRRILFGHQSSHLSKLDPSFQCSRGENIGNLNVKLTHWVLFSAKKRSRGACCVYQGSSNLEKVTAVDSNHIGRYED